MAKIAAEYQIHPGQLHRWKAIDNFSRLFTESQAIQQQAQAHERQLAELYVKSHII